MKWFNRIKIAAIVDSNFIEIFRVVHIEIDTV